MGIGCWIALQGATAGEPPTGVDNLTYDTARHSVMLDITGPVAISTRSLHAPARLVVDIPQARLRSRNRAMEVGDPLVSRVRLSQWRLDPPTVRVVIETATETEPLIAVQQTARRLFITLAPARPDEDGGKMPAPNSPETVPGTVSADHPTPFTPPPAPAASRPPLRYATPAPLRPVTLGHPSPLTRFRLTPAWRPSPPPVDPDDLPALPPSAAPTVKPSPEPVASPEPFETFPDVP